MKALLTILAIAAYGAAFNAVAQTVFPSKTVRVIVPVPGGGLQDRLARALAQDLASAWGQPVIVENRPGASGVIAAELVARSAPDGYTLFMTDNVTLMTNQFLRSGLPYDPVKDFVPVIGLVRGPDVLVVNADQGPRSVQDLISRAKAKPDGLNYGTFGVGSAAHLDTLAFNEVAAMRNTHIPYKGGTEIVAALLAGQVDFAFTGVSSVLPMIKQGRLRALAYGSRDRSPALPDVPTFVELGLPYFETGGWFGWLAPGATPTAVVERIAADTGRIVATQAFREKYVTSVALEVMNLQPAAFAALLAETREAFGRRLKGMKLD